MLRSKRPSRLERLAATALAGGRIAIGAGLWLTPRVSLRALGFAEPSGDGLALARVAATRDLVLGAWQLSALDDPDELARASTAVAVCDAGDVLTFALLARGGQASAAARGLAGAVPATLLGIWLASRHRS